MAENIKITVELEDKASPALNNIKQSANGLESAMSALGLAFSAKQTLDYIGTIQTLDNKLRLVTDSASELNSTYKDLYDISQATRQGLQPTIDLYSKLALGTKDLGIGQQELKNIVEAFNKTLVVSGTSTIGAAAATYQFAQAMQSGRLQGDELRTMLETNPKFMDVLRNTTGLTTAELRKLASDGFLSTAIVAQALQDGLGDLNGEMSKMPKTVGQSITSLGNAFQSTVRDFLDASNAGGVLNGIFEAMERNIVPLTIALIALSAALAIGATIQIVSFALGGLATAAGVATTAVAGLSTALTFLAKTPLGRVITGLAVAGGAILSFTDETEAGTKSQGFFSQAIEWGKQKLTDFGIIAGKTEKPVQNLGNTTQDLTKAVKDNNVVSDKMNKLLDDSGVNAKKTETAFSKYGEEIQTQIEYSKLFSDERKTMIEIDKVLQKTVDEGRKVGKTYTASELANMKERLVSASNLRDGMFKITADLENRYKGYIEYIKSNQDKSLSDSQKFEKDVEQATKDRQTNTRFSEEEFQKYLEALRANYSAKYRKLIEDEKTANMTQEQKFQVELAKLEEDSRANRLSKDINFEEAKDALRSKYNSANLAMQKAAKESLLSDQEKFDAAMTQAQTNLNTGLFKNQSDYQAQVDALKTNYTKKYRDLETQAQTASMTDTQKYTEALKKIEDDFLAGRFSSYEQYTKAKENTDTIHNKKLWDEAEKYRIQEGGAFAAYQETLSQLQKDKLAGRFQNEEQYMALVRAATEKLNTDVASKYSNMYNTVETKLLEMIGVNKEKWPLIKEVVSLFGIDTDKILKDLFKQAITYVLGFTNPAGASVTTLGGVFSTIFGSGGTAPKDVNLFTSTAGNLFSSFGTSVLSIFSGLGSGLSSVFTGLYNFLSNNVLDVLGDIISSAATAVSSLLKVGSSGGGSSSSWVDDVISIGSAIWSFFSDARMKENVQYNQTLPNGINLYDFNYKSKYNLGNDTKTGVLAQEVKGKYPNAVNENKSGMLMVDYNQLPIPKGLLKLAKGGVLGAPTLLGGGTAIGGEAGPEAVLPLDRGPDGRLGVVSSGQSNSPINISFTINAVDAKGLDDLLLNKKTLITNMVRSAVQERGVRI